MNRASFLAEIRAAPADDATRLVYADWLDDEGDHSRAEFVRAQCRLATMDADDPEYDALSRREGELLADHGDGWYAELPDWLRQRVGPFERGLPGVLSVTLEEFKQRGREALAKHVFAGLKVRKTGESRLDVLATCAGLEDMRSLELEELHAPEEQVRTLLNSDRLGNLAVLSLHSFLAERRNLRELYCTDRLPNLRRLSPYDMHAGVPVAEVLSSPAVRRLHHLNCSWRPGEGERDDPTAFPFSVPETLKSLRVAGWMSPADGFDMLAGRTLAGLETLDMSVGGANRGGPTIPDDCAMPRLKRLALQRMFVNPATLHGVLRPNRFPSLVELNVADTPLGEDDVNALLNSPGGSRLQSLNVGSITGSTGSGRCFAGEPMSHLLALDISGWVALDFAHLLGHGPPLPLRRFNLTRVELPTATLRLLLSSGRFANLRDLSLRKNHSLGDAAADLLAAFPLPHLRRLDLRETGCTDRTVRTLLAAGVVRGLSALNVRDSAVGDAGVTLLARSEDSRGLRELDVVRTGMTDAGAKALAESPHLGAITSLKAWQNAISDKPRQLLRKRFGTRVRLDV